MHPLTVRAVLVVALALCSATGANGQRVMEKLGRGVIALRKTSTQVYVGWRLHGQDPADIGFNVYRSANGAAAVKLNATPITQTTDFLDTTAVLTSPNAYWVTPVINGVEGAPSGAYTLRANSPAGRRYLPVPLQPFADGTYSVGFTWVGDLDGDSEYDFVVTRIPPTGTSRILEGYLRDGTFKWRIDDADNTSNFGDGDGVTVYDMDGDGRAEVMMRTGAGTVFGDGTTIPATDTNQYISVIDGQTGAELARTVLPHADKFAIGNLGGRMAIAYLDGIHPSLVFDYDNRNPDLSFNYFHSAWDYRNGQLVLRWDAASYKAGTLDLAMAHSVRVADVNNDGKDEILQLGGVYGDGAPLFGTDLVHGDRFVVADIDPDRPGLENFNIQQNNPHNVGMDLYEAANGRAIKKWFLSDLSDLGRGDVEDLDPDFRGMEVYSTMGKIYDCKGNKAFDTSIFPKLGVWWDADLQREIIHTVDASGMTPGINKWNLAGKYEGRIYSPYTETWVPEAVLLAGGTGTAVACHQNYAGRPTFFGDIFGDWREEIVYVANDYSELRVYSNFDSSTTRLYSLMENPAYRSQVTCKGYVQSPYPDYYLGADMEPPCPPPSVEADRRWKGGLASNAWNAGTTANWLSGATGATFAQGNSVLFDLSGNNTSSVALSGTLTPSAVTVYSPIAYTFSGTGSLSGSMPLVKAGSGTLTLNNTNAFSGNTTVWDGALVVNGNLTQSRITVYGGTWGGAAAHGATGGRIGGNGTLGGNLTMRFGGGITPGAGMGAVGTLKIAGSLTEIDGVANCFDLGGNATAASDRLAVAGNLQLGGVNTIFINPLAGTLAAGTYTLITYNGTLTGGLANLRLDGLAGIPGDLVISPGAIQLVVKSTRAAASLIWRGNNGSQWDLATTSNWLRGGTTDSFVPGDAVAFDPSGAANPGVDLVDDVNPASVTVSSGSNYTFSGNGSITGSTGLTKTGNGTLTILNENTYTGPTALNGGVLEVASIYEAGTPSSIGAAGSAASNLMLTSGTLRFLGAQGYTDRSATIGAAGCTIDIPGSANILTLMGNLTGTGKLVKTGAGILQLNASNTHAGGTVIKAGVVSLGTSVANVSGTGSGNITMEGGTLKMIDLRASESAYWNLIVPAGASAQLNTDGRCSLRGALTGNGALTVSTPYVRTDFYGNWSQFAGRILFDGDIRVANTYGYGKAAVALGAASMYYISSVPAVGQTIDIGELSGNANGALSGAATAANVLTYRVGTLNTDATYAGVIKEQGNSTVTAVTKAGNGTWTLSGANTYRGATTVSAGTLVLDGSLAGTNVAVQNGATLKNHGSITGNVLVQAGGRLSSVGTITGNLTNNGTITLTGGETLFVGGSFINNGTLDTSLWRGTLPPNLINNGTIIPSALPSLSITAPAANPAVIADISVSLRLTAALTGPGPITTAWSKVSGPGTVTFANAVSADTTAQFSAEGVYALQCVATNASGSDAKQMTVIVGPQSLTFRQGVNGCEHTAAMIREDSTAWNSGARDQLLVGKTSGGLRAVLEYDLSNLPSNLGVTSATLDLWTAGNGTVDDVELRALSGNVVEGTGDGSIATNGAGTGVTWVSRDGQTTEGHLWTTAGGDFETPVLSSVAGFTANGTNTRKTFDSGADFVAAAQAALGGNFGLIVISPTTESGVANRYAKFASDDYATVAQRPILTIAIDGTPLATVATGNAPSATSGIPAALGGSVGNATTSSWSRVSGPGTATFADAAEPATMVTFSMAGTYVLRLAATNVGGETSRDFTVNVSANPGAFADWQSAQWPGVTDQNTIGASADPDRDGLPNFLEFALALPPMTAGPATQALSAGAGTLDYSYTRRKNAVGVTYIVEWSDSLAGGSWSTNGVTQTVVPPDSDPIVQTVKASVPAASVGKRFVRLRVRFE